MRRIIKQTVAIGLLLMVGASLTACGSTYDQEGTLKRGLEKSYTGAPLTKQEKREVESYKKWEKEYDAQQYNSKYY